MPSGGMAFGLIETEFRVIGEQFPPAGRKALPRTLCTNFRRPDDEATIPSFETLNRLRKERGRETSNCFASSYVPVGVFLRDAMFPQG